MQFTPLALVTTVPIPGPAESAGGGTPTDPMTYVVPIAVAVVGLVGLAVAAWIASRSAIRVRIVDMLREEGEVVRAFQVRTVSAVNEVLIAMGQVHLSLKAKLDQIAGDAQARAQNGGAVRVNVTIELHHDPEQLQRVRTATAEWRAVLAESQYHSDQQLANALQAWDEQRERVVLALNREDMRDLETAGEALDRLGEVETRQLYRVLQVRKVQSTLSVAHALGVWGLHRYSVKWVEHLRNQIQKGNDLIASGAGPRPGA